MKNHNGDHEPFSLEKNKLVSFHPHKRIEHLFLDSNKILDEILQIRANLLRKLTSRPEIILVTSGHRGAGVSTIALNLSALLAELPNEKVLLIDENFKNPTLTRGFKLENCPGFCNLIEEKVQLKDTIRKTNLTNLYFMGVGDYYNPKMRIGRSLEMDRILKILRHHFTLILIDGQPIEPSPGTIYLAGKAKNVLLVIESETSRQEIVRNNIKRLENMGAKIVGAVLNRRRFYIPSWLYKIV